MGFLDDFFKKYKKSESVAVTVDDIDKLPTFSDVDLGLYWNRITEGNLSDNEKYFAEMLEWAKDPNIQKYISYSIPIDELFRSYVVSDSKNTMKNKCNLYFCFNDRQDFVGLAYVSAPIGKNTSSSIDYLIVNPKFQRSGIGTKMIKSISSYMDYFNNGYESDGFVVSVNSENVASSRALLKNNYKVISTNWTDLGKHYTVLYLSRQDIENSTEDLEK